MALILDIIVLFYIGLPLVQFHILCLKLEKDCIVD